MLTVVDDDADLNSSSSELTNGRQPAGRQRGWRSLPCTITLRPRAGWSELSCRHQLGLSIAGDISQLADRHQRQSASEAERLIDWLLERTQDYVDRCLHIAASQTLNLLVYITRWCKMERLSTVPNVRLSSVASPVTVHPTKQQQKQWQSIHYLFNNHCSGVLTAIRLCIQLRSKLETMKCHFQPRLVYIIDVKLSGTSIPPKAKLANDANSLPL